MSMNASLGGKLLSKARQVTDQQKEVEKITEAVSEKEDESHAEEKSSESETEIKMYADLSEKKEPLRHAGFPTIDRLPAASLSSQTSGEPPSSEALASQATLNTAKPSFKSKTPPKN